MSTVSQQKLAKAEAKFAWIGRNVHDAQHLSSNFPHFPCFPDNF